MQVSLLALARRLLGPGLLLAAAAALATGWGAIGAAVGLSPEGWLGRNGGMIAAALAWLAAAAGLIRLLDVAFWRWLVERRSGMPVPRLLVDLMAGLVWVATALIVIALVFAQPVSGLLTTSGVVIAVIGFALRDMIASLFSGIALNLERPYRIGDWIEVDPGVVGQVQEVSWLTTRTVTRDGIGVVIPNARLATAPFRNYDQPHAAFRDSVGITLDFGVPAERVERILLAAMKAVPAVASADRPPDVKADGITDWGIRWLARYWVSDYGARVDVRDAVQRSLLRQLHHAGIAIPYPKEELFVGRMAARGLDPVRNVDAILARNELFASLARDDLRALAEQATRQYCPAGMPVVREGDAGASLFVLVEGLLRVLRRDDDGVEWPVSSLVPGDAFGEFSLLTGERRSDTVVPEGDAVVYEITKQDLEPILHRQPDLARRLGWILAQRQMSRRLEGRPGQAAAASTGPAAHLWLDRVQAFFSLGRNHGSAGP